MTTDQNATTVDEFLAIPAVQRFCAALKPFVGDGLVGLLGKYADPAQASEVMEAPATFNASIGREMNEAMDRQEPPADRDFGRLILCTLEIVQKMRSATQTPEQCAVADAGRAAIALLRATKAKVGWDAAAEAVVGKARLGASLFPSVYAIIGMFRAAWGVLRGPFETRTDARLAAVKRMAENVYKPLLMRFAELARMLRSSAPTLPANPQLGQVMSELRQAGYVAFLDENVRLLRNSEAHCSYEVDTDREEVRFVDRNSAAVERALGPWSEVQLRDFCERFLMLCLTLFLALSGFLADEALDQIAKEHPAWLENGPPAGNAVPP
jgi:hypothetical protein